MNRKDNSRIREELFVAASGAQLDWSKAGGPIVTVQTVGRVAESTE